MKPVARDGAREPETADILAAVEWVAKRIGELIDVVARADARLERIEAALLRLEEPARGVLDAVVDQASDDVVH